MIEQKYISIAQRLTDQRKGIFNAFSSAFLLEYEKGVTNTFSTSSKEVQRNNYNFDNFYSKPITSEQLSILSLKASKIYMTLGISCNGSELPKEEQHINIVIKDFLYYEKSASFSKLNFASPKFQVDEFKTLFSLFKTQEVANFQELVNHLIKIFRMNLFQDAQSSKEIDSYVRKHHHMFWN